MGLFSGILKGVKKIAAPIASAVGAYYGAPYIGNIFGKVTGGSDFPGGGGDSEPPDAPSDGGGLNQWGWLPSADTLLKGAGSFATGALDTLKNNAGTIAAGALSGYAQYKGQQEANDLNRELADKQMAFQTAANQKAMDFSERMSSTSWQRSVADMEAAGINPMLAFMKGGASAPTGVSSSGASASMQNAMGPAVTSAIAAARSLAEIRNIEAQTATQEVETKYRQQQVHTAQSQEELNRAHRVQSSAEVERLLTDVDRIVADTQLSRTRREQVAGEIRLNIRQGNWLEVQRQAKELELPELVVRARSIMSPSGDKNFRGYYLPYVHDVSEAVSSALGIKRLFIPSR